MHRFPGVALATLAYPRLFFSHASGVLKGRANFSMRYIPCVTEPCISCR